VFCLKNNTEVSCVIGVATRNEQNASWASRGYRTCCGVSCWGTACLFKAGILVHCITVMHMFVKIIITYCCQSCHEVLRYDF